MSARLVVCTLRFAVQGWRRLGRTHARVAQRALNRGGGMPRALHTAAALQLQAIRHAWGLAWGMRAWADARMLARLHAALQAGWGGRHCTMAACQHGRQLAGAWHGICGAAHLRCGAWALHQP